LKKNHFFAILAHFLYDYLKKSSNFAPVMRNLPIVTRYLLIANVIVFMMAAVLQRIGIDLNAIGGLHYLSAQSFHWWQPVTYMFLHANLSHIFFNMFAVWMFAPTIEREWGARRFALYYLICGLGAAVIQELVWMAMLSNMTSTYGAAAVSQYAYMLNTIGASGAVFGILFAFGWLYPDVPMYILFVPFPLRARTFVIIYALIELFAGLGTVAGFTADNVAHFAHLGGMLFGWLLILYWKKTNWREPGELWNSIRAKITGHHRLNSVKDDKFDNYHYQKRV
jgi:membrane associated rhomboid family serine protease